MGVISGYTTIKNPVALETTGPFYVDLFRRFLFHQLSF